jgi:hypothetical protein
MIPHPFFGRFLYHLASILVGFENVRIVPIVLSALTLVLLFWYMRSRFDVPAALASAVLFVVPTYALLHLPTIHSMLSLAIT